MDRRHLLGSLAAVGAAALVGCTSDEPTARRTTSGPSPPRTPSATPGSPSPTDERPVRPRKESVVAEGLGVPWGIAFLSTGEALVSLRDEARIVRVGRDGVRTVGDVPGVVPAAGLGEGGLLGLAVPPGDDSVVYAFHTSGSDDRVVRMSYSRGRLGRPEPVLAGIPTSTHHHGGRLLFDGRGRLFVSTGDAEQRELAQDRDSLAGKVLRVDRDGRPVDGNPFGNHTWTYGHRNVEGLALDASGRLWATEFGDKAADELNLLQRGGNYGWPQVEGEGGGDGLVDPKVTWGTSECSPAGLAITRSTAFLGALQGRCLFSVPLRGERAGRPRRHLDDGDRVRSVAVAPDGALWVTTSNTDGRREPARGDDRIWRVTI